MSNLPSGYSEPESLDSFLERQVNEIKRLHESGEVINTAFYRDAPLEGRDKVSGFVWRATPVAALTPNAESNGAKHPTRTPG